MPKHVKRESCFFNDKLHPPLPLPFIPLACDNWGLELITLVIVSVSISLLYYKITIIRSLRDVFEILGILCK